MSSDIPTGLVFVDPNETPTTYRVGLFAPPGYGKSVTAASAPAPILLVNADRPAAYAFARKHHRLSGNQLREVRYEGVGTLNDVYRYLDSDAGSDIKTVIVDPVGNITDNLRDVAPKREGEPDYAWVNAKLFGFVKSLRTFNVHVVLVAHEKLNDGKKGDGKIYPQFGGLTLINKIMGELDICAHIERVVREVEGQEKPEEVWIGQLQPRDNIVCKESTGGSLGEKRVANLSRWFEVADGNLALDESDIPFSDSYVDPAVAAEAAQAADSDDEKTASSEQEIGELEDEALGLWTPLVGEVKALQKVRNAGGHKARLKGLITSAKTAARKAAQEQAEAVAA